MITCGKAGTGGKTIIATSCGCLVLFLNETSIFLYR